MTKSQNPTRIILVVDDEPVNVQLLKRKLEWDGMKVLTASNGQACLDIAKAEEPDLILLDVMMPGMDGLEVCQKLRENELTKGIPVIFVTAQNSKEGKLEGLQAGAVDYITKPIDIEETTARVRAQLKYLAINQENVELTRRLGESRRTAAVGALTQGIAHNLNNMLGVVMGYLELAKANSGDPEKVLKNIDRVENTGNRIVGIIKQLSTVAFTTRLALHSMSVDRLITGSIHRAQEKVGENFTVTVLNDIKEKTIRTNIEAFEDALSKLLINAWESYDSSSVAKPIYLRSKTLEDGSALEFIIEDQGSGIDPELEDNMFEPFVSTKNTVGVGMGLTIARHAIRTLGGEVYIQPGAQRGAVVTFDHPLTKETNSHT
jgi:two-component system sensor histidine kinase/response regulator|tara:strand:+ start:454 stop:1581 length:1128 start_codon:yes stop_codon:yes gene_type:complete